MVPTDGSEMWLRGNLSHDLGILFEARGTSRKIGLRGFSTGLGVMLRRREGRGIEACFFQVNKNCTAHFNVTIERYRWPATNLIARMNRSAGQPVLGVEC